MRAIFLIFAVSRVLQVALLTLAQHLFHYPIPKNPASDFILYDAFRYGTIATHGYQDVWNTAFFPLYPILIHVVMWFGIPVYAAGLIVSNASFLGVLIVLDKLMKNKGVDGKKRKAVLWFLALFPSSFYFTAMYTESLFLLVSLLAFYQFERGRIGSTYLIGGVAALVRSQGVFVPIAFFVERLISGRLRIKDVVYGCLSAAIAGGYPLYLQVTKGNPLWFAKVQSHYFRVPGYPLEAVIVDLHRLFSSTHKASTLLIIIHMGILLMLAIYIVWFFIHHRPSLRNAPFAELIFTLAVVLLPLSTMATQVAQVATMGLLRFVLEAFPFFIFWGLVAHRLFVKQKLGIKYRLGGYLLFAFLVYGTFFVYTEEAMRAYIA